MTAKPCPTCGKPPHDPRNAETWGPDCACECPRPLTAAEVDRICGLVSSAYDGARLLAYVRELERRDKDGARMDATIRAALGARDGETAAEAAARVECERDSARAELGSLRFRFDTALWLRDLAHKDRDSARAELSRLRALVGRAVRPDCGCDVCVDAGTWRVTP